MFVSSFVSVFNVVREKDDKGNDIPVAGKHAVDIALRCAPFKFELRHEAIRILKYCLHLANLSPSDVRYLREITELHA